MFCRSCSFRWKLDFPVSDLLPVWKGRSEVNGCTADSAALERLFCVMACFVSDAAVSAGFLQQQMLSQHQQSQPQASPEYLTSSGILPALCPTLHHFSSGLDPWWTPLIVPIGKYFSTEHKGNHCGGGVTMELESLSIKWLLNLEPILWVLYASLLVLSSVPVHLCPSFHFHQLVLANCSLQIRLGNIQQHLRLRKGKGKLLSKSKAIVEGPLSIYSSKTTIQ